MIDLHFYVAGNTINVFLWKKLIYLISYQYML